MKLKQIVSAAALLAAGLWVLSLIPFSSTIRQEIPANIYTDGAVTSTTTVTIDGKRTNYIVRENRYFGEFSLPEVPRTEREGVNVSIRWNDAKTNTQFLIYHTAGTSISLIPGRIAISEDMTRFACYLADGTVLATSDEAYKNYTAHVTYGSETRFTAIDGAVPAI